MKLTETELVIRAYIDGLQAADAERPAMHLQPLAELFKEFPDQTMANFIKCYRKAQRQYQAEPHRQPDEPTIADLIPHLDALDRILKAGRSPASRTNDLGLLIDLLRSSNDSNGDSRYLFPMLKALRQALTPQTPEQVAQEFVGRLKAAKGSAQFESIYSELVEAKLRTEYVVEIAQSIFGELPKSISRKSALAYIRKPHDAFMSAKRGIEATGGRSAA